MRNFTNYYVDGVIFANENEINNFVKSQAVESYKTACKYFANHPTMEASVYASDLAERLVNKFGFTWFQVEELETSALATM